MRKRHGNSRWLDDWHDAFEGTKLVIEMVPIEYGKALMGTQMYGEKLAHDNSSIVMFVYLDKTSS